MHFQLRNLGYAATAATRLTQVALIPEVGHALNKWNAYSHRHGLKCVLIGGLALSFYAKPRATEDVDILFLELSDVPDTVPGFKRHRTMALREDDTNVEIKLVVFLSMLETLIPKVFATAVYHDGLKVASLEGMVALKLYGAANSTRRMHRDLADVVAMLERAPELDMSGWPLNIEHLTALENCRKRAKS